MKFEPNLLKTFALRDEMDNIESYLDECSSKESLNFSKRTKFPKISIISPVFNRGEYLLRFLKSIQFQEFKDIEIILIDDFSSDNTLSLIKQYQKIDKRILLIKNRKNYGTFKSRNLGIIKSTGKYLILPDPDDILSKNCLKILYDYATKYDYEILRFNLYIGKKRILTSKSIEKIPNKPVFQPELLTFIFYGSGSLQHIDFNISNKFIKREALIRALNLLSKNYLNMHMILLEDGTLNYLLHRTAKSFYYLKIIGYYYINNKRSITNKIVKICYMKYIFIYLKIVFEFSKNNEYEKNMFNILFHSYIVKHFVIAKMNINKEYLQFYNDTTNMFLENEFISINNRKYLIELKNYIKTLHK